MKNKGEKNVEELISKMRAGQITGKRTPSSDRLEAIEGMFSTPGTETTTPGSVQEAEKKAKKRIRAVETWIDKEVAEAIEREAEEKKNTSTKEKDKKRMTFIINDPESVDLLKKYCFLHDMRIQDVFEVIIKDFLSDPDRFEVPTRKY